MICNTCGRYIQSEDANFCEYCGTSFKNSNNTINQTQTTNSSSSTPPLRQETININPKEKKDSFLSWLGTYLIMFIPLVGGIVFLVMLLIWSFGNAATESKKNWARATLVFYVIMIALIILLMTLSVAMLNNPLFENLKEIESNELFDLIKEYK